MALVRRLAGCPPSAWEWDFEPERCRETANYRSALAVPAYGRERFPGNPACFVAAACWATRSGNADAAIAALKAAFELDPRCVEWAKGDADLDAIRGLPGLGG